MTKIPLDTKEFRNALGSFATGVTIVTTALLPDKPVGVTASSFNSVSLDPPLILWSLAKKALSLEAFEQSGHFAVHILSALQEDLSNAFASSGTDKYENVDWKVGELGSPVFDEFTAKFECKTVHQYEGGDHIIFVGEVVAFDKRDHPPLVFHAGRYAEARPKPAPETLPNVELETGRFTEDFFLYLLSRAYFQTSSVSRDKAQKFDIKQSEYMAMTVLAMEAPLSHMDLQSRLSHTGHAPSGDTVQNMQSKNLIVKNGSDQFCLTNHAQAMIIEMLSETKAFEDDLLGHFTPGEIADTKRVLKKVISLTEANIPKLWG